MRSFIKLTIAATVMALASGTAAAADFTIALTGNLGDTTESQFDFNGLHYDAHYLNLSGLDASNAITVAEGDTVTATVTLDQALTVQASPHHTDFLLFLGGGAFPSEDTGVTGAFDFYDGGALVKSFTYNSTTSGQLASYAALFGANNTTFTFDSFTVGVSIYALASPATLDGSSLEYAYSSPGVAAVPEPANWAMMLAGFGAIGVAARQRKVRMDFAA